MHYFPLMSLFIFLIVVLSLASGSVAPAEVPLQQCVVATAGLMLAWGMLAKTAAAVALARVQSGTQPLAAIETFERQLDILRWLGLGATLLCLIGFNLAGAVQGWPLFASSMFLQSLVLLAPGMTMIALTLLTEHQLGVAMGYTEPGVWETIKQIVRSMLRFVGWMVVPILAMLLLSDLISLIPAGMMPWSEEVPTAAVLAIAMIMTVPVLVPVIAKRVWKTRPMNDSSERWIVDLVASAGLPGLDVRLWCTGMKSANAVVIGFFPGLRSLLLTDRLVRDVSPAQLRLIILHEVAHLRRWHLWIRMLSVLPGWLIAAALLRWFGTDSTMLLISNAVAIGGTLVLLRLAAHLTEFDADRIACEIALSLPEAKIEAEWTPGKSSRRTDKPLLAPLQGAAAHGAAHEQAQHLCRTLLEITGGSADSHRSSWLHPSVAARCDRLLRWADQQTTPSGLSFDAPFSNPAVHPILCASAAVFAASETQILEKIDESNRCDYVQG